MPGAMRSIFNLFQSRNRGSFDFKTFASCWNAASHPYLFQSRNRGSFDFKGSFWEFIQGTQRYFNLVIEVLLISSDEAHAMKNDKSTFQSRNRGSFDFKGKHHRIVYRSHSNYFNLVIEVLLISSIISRWRMRNGRGTFQSRNRGSFDFKYDENFGEHPVLKISIS